MIVVETWHHELVRRVHTVACIVFVFVSQSIQGSHRLQTVQCIAQTQIKVAYMYVCTRNIPNLTYLRQARLNTTPTTAKSDSSHFQLTYQHALPFQKRKQSKASKKRKHSRHGCVHETNLPRSRAAEMFGQFIFLLVLAHITSQADLALRMRVL